MRIVFIRPNLGDHRSSDAMEPLVFAILKALTPERDEVVLYDERVEPLPEEIRADLVAITVETFTACRSYQIAAACRQRGIPVVMGGFHPTLATEECAAQADAVVVGDAEGLWPQVVEDARQGRLQPVYRQSSLPPLGGVLPDRSLFRGKSYAPVALVQYGRGCRYHCEFCSIRSFYGGRLRQRPLPEFVREIEGLGRRHLMVVDDNLFSDREHALAFCRALAPLRVTWSCQISIDVAADPALMRWLERSGCTTAVIGFESLDPANLVQMRKGWNLKHGGYAEALRVFHQAGLMIYGTFLFGYDHDRPDSFRRAVDFAVENRFFLANFNPLTPTPGTALIERLRREGRMRHDAWWLDPGYRYGQATFHPRGLTPDELTEGCYRARRDFNSLRNIGMRLLDTGTHWRSPRRLGIYLACNWISRREIARKQGARFGSADLPPLTA